MAIGGTAFKLRSSTLGDTYTVFEYDGHSGVTAGDMAKINDVVGVFVSTKATGVADVFVWEATRIVVPCAAMASGAGDSGVWEVGCKVYFDSSAETVTQTASGNTPCGIVQKNGAVGDTTVEITLIGALGVVS